MPDDALSFRVAPLGLVFSGGSLLIADDLGDTVWRVSAAAGC